jgi:tRNA(fMet)-specific endonuclease VapC
MSFLLDTDIGSAHIRRPSGLMHRFVQHSGRLFVPTVGLAELYVWAYLRPDPRDFLAAIATFLKYDVQTLAFDEASAEQFGKLRVELQRVGIAVSPIDLLIASAALAHDLTLVTHNTADHRNIPDLRLEDWLTP